MRFLWMLILCSGLLFGQNELAVLEMNSSAISQGRGNGGVAFGNGQTAMVNPANMIQDNVYSVWGSFLRYPVKFLDSHVQVMDAGMVKKAGRKYLGIMFRRVSSDP